MASDKAYKKKAVIPLVMNGNFTSALEYESKARRKGLDPTLLILPPGGILFNMVVLWLYGLFAWECILNAETALDDTGMAKMKMETNTAIIL